MAPRPPIVLLHGFTQTHVSWRPVIERLDSDLQVTAIDLPGHGASTDLRSDLAGSAAVVAEHIGGDPALVVGYSMGGRVALRLALDHPGSLRGLVLLGATAGIDEPDERAARRATDEDLAQQLERDGVQAFVDRWLAQPLFADLAPEPDDLAARRSNTVEGLASSLRHAGTGTMDPPWWDELGSIDVPTLVCWGDRDGKFAAIGQRMAAAIGPNTRPAVLLDAGHAAHLEQPAPFATLTASFATDL